MPFDLSLAVSLGKWVQCAYAASELTDPTQVSLSDPSYSLVNVLYGDDQWDKKSGYVPFGLITQSNGAPYTLVVSLRGTENIWDWMANVSFIRKRCPLAGAPNGAETEDGFTSLYNTLSISKDGSPPSLNVAVQNLISSLGAANVGQVNICGHSLGGALATLAAADLVGSGVQPPVSAYTFASPAVGEKTFATWYDGLVPDSYRVFNSPDIVPTLPPALFGYTHVDEPYPINSGPSVQNNLGCYHSLATYLHTLDSSQPLETDCVAAQAG